MEIKIAGRAYIIRFIEAAIIAVVAMFNPEALTLRDDKGNVVFKVKLVKGIPPSISKFGIEFDDVSTEGKAQLTGTFPGNVSNEGREAYIIENFAVTMTHAEALAAQIQTAYTAALAIQGKVKAAMTID